MIYLASPYTPHSGESVEERVAAVCQYAAKLMQRGHSVFSPIAHSHAVATHMPDHLRFEHSFWMRQDLPLLRHASKLLVLKLPGWKESEGIKREIEVAMHAQIPVEFVEP